jgi:alkylation response protein AidB-like acyl-CoA dehydrogenase
VEFTHTDERRMLQDSLRRYLGDRCAPAQRKAILAEPAGFSAEIWAGLAELGVIGALFPEDEGGFGGAGFDLMVVFEEIGRAGAVDPLIETAILGGGLLADLGSDAQKGKLEPIIAGETQLAFAGLEPGGRYDLDHVTARAEGTGDGVKLTGRKAVVTNAPAADLLLVTARANDGNDRDGIGVYLVAPDAPGLTMRDYALTGGGRAAEITLEATPAEPLGDGARAWPAIERASARATLALCAEALGLMETAIDLTLDYMRQRKQFGQPIGKFQALQHRIADVVIEREQARSAVINLAGHLDGAPELRELHVSAAKNLIGRVGRLVAEEAIQIHGGIAMTQEYELAHIAKRLVMIDHRFGDAEHHLERFIHLSRGAA